MSTSLTRPYSLQMQSKLHLLTQIFQKMTVTVTGLPRQLGNYKPVATEEATTTTTWAPPKSHRRFSETTTRPIIQSSHDRVATVSRILTGNRGTLGEIHRRIETEADSAECQEQPQRRSPTQGRLFRKIACDFLKHAIF